MIRIYLLTGTPLFVRMVVSSVSENIKLLFAFACLNWRSTRAGKGSSSSNFMMIELKGEMEDWHCSSSI